MAENYTYLFLIIITWGIWGFLGKYALKYVNISSLVLLETIWAILFQFVLIFLLFYWKGKFQLNSTGILLTMLTAFFSMLGLVLFYFTLSKTKVSVLVPLTALYPVITVILSFVFLKEKVTLVQGIGIALAVVAGVLLSI